jgi:eukaryotic-like serine/threonine-protein kinase
MTCRNCFAPLGPDADACSVCGAQLGVERKTDPLIGRVLLNQYVIQRKLGEGGFGAVYEAEQPAFRRKVAIKTLHKHLVSSPNLIKRFHREGLVASQLEHPSAVKMLSLGETEDGYLWIAMEFLQGPTLTQRIQEVGALPLLEFASIIIPVCEALAEAHSKQIIHRDLKPDNIMLVISQGKSIPKVLDFGIAGIINDGDGPTKTGSISGTPPYMPPEQWKGLKFTDARTDIYALGLIAYQCLSGLHPYHAETGPDWMLKHFMETPIPLNDAVNGGMLPPSMQAVVMKSIEKSASDRYQSMLEFRDALLEALRETPTLTPRHNRPASSSNTIQPIPSSSVFAGPQPTPLPLPEPKKKKKPLAIVAGLFGFLLMLVVGYIVFGADATPQRATPVAAPLTGAIALQTSPEQNMTIYVDGNKLSNKTPIVSPPLSLSAGSHKLVFEAATGQKTNEFIVEIFAGQTIEKTFDLNVGGCPEECLRTGGVCKDNRCVLIKTESVSLPVELPEKKVLTPQEQLNANLALEKIKFSVSSNKCDDAFSLLYQYKKKYGTDNPEYWWNKAICAEKIDAYQACASYLNFLQASSNEKRNAQAREYIQAQDRKVTPNCVLP